MKKWLSITLVLALVVVGVAGCAPKEVAPKEHMAYTVPEVSGFHPQAVQCVELINEYCPDQRLTGRAVGGMGTEFHEMFVEKSLDYTMLMLSDAAYCVGVGKGGVVDAGLVEQHSTMRWLWALDISTFHFVVRADSGVETIYDLEGKRFSGGMAKSATGTIARDIMSVLDIHPDWFEGSYKDALAATKDRRIVGVVKMSPRCGLDASIAELKATTPIRVLSMPKDKLDLLKKEIPRLFWETVPAGAISELPGHPELVLPASLCGGVALSDRVTPEEAYCATKAVVEHWDRVVSTYAAAAKIDPIGDMVRYLSELPPGGVWLHAGTVKYCKEIGIEVPTSLIPSEYQ